MHKRAAHSPPPNAQHKNTHLCQVSVLCIAAQEEELQQLPQRSLVRHLQRGITTGRAQHGVAAGVAQDKTVQDRARQVVLSTG